MKISIVIATYNSGKTLKQTLDSIRHQTYKQLEVIVIDGQSTDNTLLIIDEYKDIVSYCISEKDAGIYDAFNKGLSVATGDYVCFIGSDDCYVDYDVMNKVAPILSTDNPHILSGYVYEVDSVSKAQWRRSNEVSIEKIKCGMMIPHAGMFTKLEIMKKYKFNQELRIIADYDFLLRYVLDGGDIEYIDMPIAYFEVGGTSSENIWSEGWSLKLYEHLKVIDEAGLKDKYLQKNIMEYFKISDKPNKFYFKGIMRELLNHIGLTNHARRIMKGHSKHNCNLQYCRWCGRTE